MPPKGSSQAIESKIPPSSSVLLGVSPGWLHSEGASFRHSLDELKTKGFSYIVIFVNDLPARFNALMPATLSEKPLIPEGIETDYTNTDAIEVGNRWYGTHIRTIEDVLTKGSYVILRASQIAVWKLPDESSPFEKAVKKVHEYLEPPGREVSSGGSTTAEILKPGIKLLEAVSLTARKFVAARYTSSDKDGSHFGASSAEVRDAIPHLKLSRFYIIEEMAYLVAMGALAKKEEGFLSLPSRIGYLAYPKSSPSAFRVAAGHTGLFSGMFSRFLKLKPLKSKSRPVLSPSKSLKLPGAAATQSGSVPILPLVVVGSSGSESSLSSSDLDAGPQQQRRGSWPPVPDPGVTAAITASFLRSFTTGLADSSSGFTPVEIATAGAAFVGEISKWRHSESSGDDEPGEKSARSLAKGSKSA